MTVTQVAGPSLDFAWTNINDLVPNIRSYAVKVYRPDPFVTNDLGVIVWRSRDYPISRFATTFNEDGKASEPLVIGQEYLCELIIYDSLNDATSVNVGIIIQ